MLESVTAASSEVAPFAGAWIETLAISARRLPQSRVAPFAGAWIETCRSRISPHRSWRRPLRGGVDRNTVKPLATPGQQVAPFAGAWIETA